MDTNQARKVIAVQHGVVTVQGSRVVRVATPEKLRFDAAQRAFNATGRLRGTPQHDEWKSARNDYKTSPQGRLEMLVQAAKRGK